MSLEFLTSERGQWIVGLGEAKENHPDASFPIIYPDGHTPIYPGPTSTYLSDIPRTTSFNTESDLAKSPVRLQAALDTLDEETRRIETSRLRIAYVLSGLGGLVEKHSEVVDALPDEDRERVVEWTSRLRHETSE